MVPSVTACKTFHYSAGGLLPAWRCSLDLPHSFTPCDGRRLEVTGYGNTQKEAGEAACRRDMAVLLMRSPGDVVLRPPHWRISLESLVRGLPGTVAEHQALPVHVPRRLREAGMEADRLPEAEVKERVASLLRLCLRKHGGSFDPANISRSALGQKRGEEPVYSQLNKLLKPNQLRAFVNSHPEFSWSSNGPKGMFITWALHASPPAPSSASADQTLLPLLGSARSWLNQNLGSVEEEGTIESPRAAKPAPASASTQKPAPSSASAEKPAPANSKNKMKRASSSGSDGAAVAKASDGVMPLFSAASQSLSTEVLQADAESAAAAQPARLGDMVTAREAYEDQLASSFGSGAAAVAQASDGVTPLISAARQNHRMRLWWHPGLPRLTQEGLLLVPNEEPHARRRQLHAIWDDLQLGTWSTQIPEADRRLISMQVLEWLGVIGKLPDM